MASTSSVHEEGEGTIVCCPSQSQHPPPAPITSTESPSNSNSITSSITMNDRPPSSSSPPTRRHSGSSSLLVPLLGNEIQIPIPIINTSMHQLLPWIILGLMAWSTFLLLLDPHFLFRADNVGVRAAADEERVAALSHEENTQHAPPSAVMQLSLPNVLYLGVQKAGSSATAYWLFRNGVCQPAAFPGEPAYYNKEAHFFDRDKRYEQGIVFYSKRFQHCSNLNSNLVMDATPENFVFPERVFDTYSHPGAASALSNLKIVVTLREPVARELSFYNHKVFSKASDAMYKNGTVIPFEEYSRNLRENFDLETSLGNYIDHIRDWVSLFGRERILLLSYDELEENPSVFQRRIEAFLGITIPDKIHHMNELKSPDKVGVVPPAARKVLGPLFRWKTDELYEWLKDNPGPPMEQSPFPPFTVY